MVASKTSILVAAVALGAASVYAAPAPINQDIALSRREADESALIARDFDDDELFAREFLDDLDARDFEDALEARDFDEDELYARELYEDELEARELYEDELEARELYEDELEARGFDDDEDLFARAVEVSPFSLLNPSSAGTPSSTATPTSTVTHSDGTPSPTSTSTDAMKDKHVLAATSPSTLNSDKKVHRKQRKRPRHDVCKPYRTAYKLLAGEPLAEHKVGEHDLHHHGLHAHDLKAQDKDRHHHDRHHQHRHRRQRHHKLTAEEIAHKCGREITALVTFQHHKHDAVVDASTAPRVPETLKVQTSETPKVQTSEALKVQIPETSKVQTPQTLKIQTPTKAKRGLNQLWARVVGKQSDMPAMDTKIAGQGYPDAAGPVNAQSHVLESSPSTPLPGGAENLATTPSLEGQQGPQRPGQHKKHHHHHHHHRHRNCYRYPNSKACRNRHRHNHHHNRKHRKQPKQDATGAPALDATKSVTEPNVNGGPVSDAMAVGNGAPVPVNPAASVQRRSLEDEIWERSLANSLGLDEDYFTKRFYDEDAFEF